MSGQKSRWRGVIASTFLVLLFGCDQDDTAQKPNKEAELIKAETALMSDPERAGPELERRLTQMVRIDGGVILVDASLSLFVLPVSSPWTLHCSSGMSIVFGNSISNEVSRGESSEDFESSTSNDVAIYLTVGSIDQKNCEILGPRIGKRLLAILGHDQPARFGDQR